MIISPYLEAYSKLCQTSLQNAPSQISDRFCTRLCIFGNVLTRKKKEKRLKCKEKQQRNTKKQGKEERNKKKKKTQVNK